MTYQVHLSRVSDNAKTGPIPVSTTSERTCPEACPFKHNGCYANGGPLALHWRAVTEGMARDRAIMLATAKLAGKLVIVRG